MNSFRAIAGKTTQRRPPKCRPYGRSGHRPGVISTHRTAPRWPTRMSRRGFIPCEVRGDIPLPGMPPENPEVVSFAAHTREIVAIGLPDPARYTSHLSPGPAGMPFMILPRHFRNSGCQGLPAGGGPAGAAEASRGVKPVGAGSWVSTLSPRRDVIDTARIRGAPPRQIHFADRAN